MPSVARVVSLAGDSEEDHRSPSRGRNSATSLSKMQPRRPESGVRIWSSEGRGAAARGDLFAAPHLQQAQRSPQGQPGSMAPHGARRFPQTLLRGWDAPRGPTAGGARTTCCARLARPAGAERRPPGWGRAGAAAAAAAAAAPGGLPTREAAGAGSAPPFPRCHSDPRCLAPGPGRGLPQSKGNFLVSRQRNNAPAREGAPRSKGLRLPRGHEVGQATRAAPRRRLPLQGSRPRPRRSASFCANFTFFPPCGPQPHRLHTIWTAPSHFPAPHPALFLPPHPAPPLPVFLPIFLICFLQGLFSQD